MSKNTALLQLFVKHLKLVVLWRVPNHVGICGNEKVDSLAREALKVDITNMYLPHTDYRPKITCFVELKWQELWESFPENKLHQIVPNKTNGWDCG